MADVHEVVGAGLVGDHGEAAEHAAVDAGLGADLHASSPIQTPPQWGTISRQLAITLTSNPSLATVAFSLIVTRLPIRTLP